MSVITAAPITGPTINPLLPRGAGERSDSVSGATQPPPAPALYGSPRIRFDRDAAILVIEIRDVQSGEIEQSIPDRAILEAYRRAALTGAPIPGQFREREEADPAAAAVEALSDGREARRQALRALTGGADGPDGPATAQGDGARGDGRRGTVPESRPDDGARLIRPDAPIAAGSAGAGRGRETGAAGAMPGGSMAAAAFLAAARTPGADAPRAVAREA